jgi:hypothetical protein
MSGTKKKGLLIIHEQLGSLSTCFGVVQLLFVILVSVMLLVHNVGIWIVHS